MRSPFRVLDFFICKTNAGLAAFIIIRLLIIPISVTEFCSVRPLPFSILIDKSTDPYIGMSAAFGKLIEKSLLLNRSGRSKVTAVLYTICLRIAPRSTLLNDCVCMTAEFFDKPFRIRLIRLRLDLRLDLRGISTRFDL